jgi:hypothetical protein
MEVAGGELGAELVSPALTAPQLQVSTGMLIIACQKVYPI